MLTFFSHLRWSGDWLERRWSPLLRAKERELHDIVQLFLDALVERFGVSPEDANSFATSDPLASAEAEIELRRQQQDSRSNNKRFSVTSVPGGRKSILSPPSSSNNNRDEDSIGSDLDAGNSRLQQDSLSLSADSVGSYPDRGRRNPKQGMMSTYPPPDSKFLPQHLLSAKKRTSPMVDNLFSSTNPNPSSSSAATLPSLESVRDRDRDREQLSSGGGSRLAYPGTTSYHVPAGAPPSVKIGGSFRPTGGAGPGGGSRAPLPSAPIPATLLQVAESSAMRYMKANRDELLKAPQSVTSSTNVSPLRQGGPADPNPTPNNPTPTPAVVMAGARPLPSGPPPPMGAAPKLGYGLPGTNPGNNGTAPFPSAATVVSLSRPLSRPTSRPGSGYKPNSSGEGRPGSGSGTSKPAINAAASLLVGDSAKNTARRNEDEEQPAEGSGSARLKVKPNVPSPSAATATSLSILKNHASGKRIHPTLVKSVDNVV